MDLRVPKISRSYPAAAQLAASQKGLISMKLIILGEKYK
jgi:hypothetical protein